MRSLPLVLVISACSAASGDQVAPPVRSTPAPPRAELPDRSAPEAEVLRTMEVDPGAAARLLDAHADASPTSPRRLAYELARWSAAGATAAWRDHLTADGVDCAQPEVGAAMLVLVEAALDADAPGSAAFAFAAWLDAQPRGPALSPRARSLAVRLHETLLDHEVSTESLVRATLEHDPEHGEIAGREMDTMLGSDIVAFLEAHRSASWARESARAIPQRATRGDLQDEAMRERLAETMEALGGIPRAEARAQLEASLRSFDQR